MQPPGSPRWIDAHTHLDDPRFDDDRDAVWSRAQAAGVGGAVLCAADPHDWDRLERVATALGQPFTLGLHPWWEVGLSDEAVQGWLDALSARPTPHGIGETGIDALKARTDAARARQRRTLRAHLALARERRVPVVLHVVRAFREVLDVVRADGLPDGGVVHAFAGRPAEAEEAVALGLHVSVGSAIRAAKVAAAVARVPAHRLLLETDCPDQPLHRGTRGEPADLLGVADLVAQARGSSAEAVLDAAAAAARALFPALPADPRGVTSA